MDDPWLVGRDFNVITHDGERTGHKTRDRGTTTFSDMMLDYGLEDTDFLGNRYTWTNGRLIVRHLNRTSSNHSPLLVQWISNDDLGPRPFKFLNQVRDAKVGLDEAEILYDRDLTSEHRDFTHHAQAVLNMTLSIEEGFWKQKADSCWVCEGDHNTRYFHVMAQGRRIKSRIKSIRT
ncbi:uncharacterized protein LOC111383642 [Olea europaea var. sylvestris]|uniref:uncharacterized protein LOC111383642 n=1 Tax=Olea europaea var. sylvestris TaxID=158386 RepID=UPI000C1D336D|nr:uncharacterized protein LOC111383642 [Olea europaea var. sylvestris]